MAERTMKAATHKKKSARHLCEAVSDPVTARFCSPLAFMALIYPLKRTQSVLISENFGIKDGVVPAHTITCS
jgi:hypothetical protein